MTQEERFSGTRGFQGCLVGFVFMVVVPLSISLVFNRWLGLISPETEAIVGRVSMLVAICLSGYVAARLGKNTGWTNSLIVGFFAELVLLIGILREGGRFIWLDPLFDIMNNPVKHWPVLVELTLTIPAAILGGIIWQITGGVPSAVKLRSEGVNKVEGAKE